MSESEKEPEYLLLGRTRGCMQQTKGLEANPLAEENWKRATFVWTLFTPCT
jgi:hypothetical protein